MKTRVLFTFFLCFLMIFSSEAQTRKELEKQRKELQKKIDEVNRLLFKTKKEKGNALDELSDLKRKISIREKLIRTINIESKVLTKEIKTNQRTINRLHKNLELLKADYGDMIFKSYKSKSQQSKTMFLLSSQNFYQAYKRLQYMKQYTAFRKKQANDIEVKTNLVKKLNDSLLQKKKVKDRLILSEKKEKKEIETDKKQQERLVSTIKRKEKKYRKQLKRNIRKEQLLSRRIDNLIRNAIRTSNKKVTKNTKNSNRFILSPEAKELASRFEKNKGKLPRPIDKGLIVRKFGKQKHATISGIMINSPGIHIATEKGADAKSIFNGTVMAILKQSEGKKTVMIKHGNYISVYKNLETVYVNKNEKVTTGESLGKIFTKKSDGKTTLIFVLLKNTKRLNPSDWIL